MPRARTEWLDVPVEQVTLVRLLAALAEPRRADLVRLLERRQRSQGGLCRELGMAQPLMSHHLKVLREAGLVTSTICDRVQVYRLRAEVLESLASRIAELAEHASAVGDQPPC